MKFITNSVSRILLATAFLWLLLLSIGMTRPSQFTNNGAHEDYDKALVDPKIVPASKPTNTTNNDGQMLYCLRTILQQQQLPIGTGWKKKAKGQVQLEVFAHHWDAANVHKWNEDIRMAPIPQLTNGSSCEIWEVGANTHARDTERFLQQYPTCFYHAYEPIPAFFEQLNKHWSHESRVTPHSYGLGPEDSTFRITASELNGEST